MCSFFLCLCVLCAAVGVDVCDMIGGRISARFARTFPLIPFLSFSYVYFLCSSLFLYVSSCCYCHCRKRCEACRESAFRLKLGRFGSQSHRQSICSFALLQTTPSGFARAHTDRHSIGSPMSLTTKSPVSSSRASYSYSSFTCTFIALHTYVLSQSFAATASAPTTNAASRSCSYYSYCCYCCYCHL